MRAPSIAIAVLIASCGRPRAARAESPPMAIANDLPALALAPRTPSPSIAAKAGKPRRRAGKPPIVGVINVNRATEAELRLLPGVGKKRAAVIVERRKRRPFANLDEVARIRGMKSIVRRLRAHLSVAGDTTARPRPRGPPG